VHTSLLARFLYRAEAVLLGSCRCSRFPEVPLVQRAALRAFLVGIQGRSPQGLDWNSLTKLICISCSNIAIVPARCVPPGGVIMLFVVNPALWTLDPTTSIIATLIYRRDVGCRAGLKVAMSRQDYSIQTLSNKSRLFYGNLRLVSPKTNPLLQQTKSSANKVQDTFCP
jgi:hypothetical protein